MKHMGLSLFFTIFSVLTLVSHAVAEVPQMISVQGKLTDSLGNGVTDGNYQITFSIYNAAVGGSVLWSSGIQTVPVARGLFTYQLGSAVQLPDDLFATDTVRYLGVTVGTDPEIIPRTRLTSGSYVYYALRADTAAYAFSSPGGGGGWTDDGTVVRLMTTSDSVGIGTTSPACKLDVNGDVNAYSVYRIGGETVLRVDNEAIALGEHTGSTFLPDLATFLGYYAGNSGGAWECTFVGHQAGYSSTDECNTFIGASAGKNNIDGYNNVFVGAHAGASATGCSNVFLGYYAGWEETGNDKLIIANSPYVTIPLIWGDFVSGRVALGTTSPFAKFTVMGEGTGIHAEVGGSFGGNAVLGKANAPSGTGIKGISMGEDGKGVYGKAEGLHGFGVYGEATQAGVGVYGDGSSVRGVGVKGVSELGKGAGVLGTAAGDNGCGVHGTVDGTDGYGVRAEALGTSDIALYVKARNSATKAILAEAENSGGVAIEAHGGPGGLAAKLYGNVNIYSNDDESLIMQLGEGLDYAEGFDISGPIEIESGTVVSIDPEHPGELMVCSSPYDTKVAGIVAGANGLGSGVRLGADGYDLDVALAGRVYCNVDATVEAIEPGDLLTTSVIPGHAMKATEYSRAQGAILGKAMQKLEKGEKGRILVLVTLQ